jgi:hypothetical protein
MGAGLPVVHVPDRVGDQGRRFARVGKRPEGELQHLVDPDMPGRRGDHQEQQCLNHP